eukprot:CAMPEP_0172881334 /NCGR_PEP_ID=MMETSP1075-20121228/117242_1 /TAXON_ID=2916 /ORGANISM="Ceratium fusus, Strain PA161109" /LENGTH=31 /DNA_ID= /DNA_START= /DNA_END= /DNA_ORIENTATION=
MDLPSFCLEGNQATHADIAWSAKTALGFSAT